jgi:hypothetical protein
MLSQNRFRILMGIAFVAGLVALGFGLARVSPQRVWEIFLTNLLFWLGVAQAGVVVSACLYLCYARWGGSGLYRLAEAGVDFLPVGFLLFWALLAGRGALFPWISHPVAAKAPYLNVHFLFARDGAGLFLMTALSYYFVYLSRRPDAVNWAETTYEEIEDPPAAVRHLAPVLVIAFVLIYTMLAIDLVMSLSPQWSSTMFGAYFTMGAAVSGLAAMGLFAACGWRPARHDTALERGGVLHDLGKLVFASTNFWTYLLFSLYLVIWYGDIPRETFFVVPRVQAWPWAELGWSAFVLIWGFPFVLLMGRQPKRSPLILGLTCLLILLGVWLERYVLIAPSLSRYAIPFGWVEALITVGFAGLFGLIVPQGLRRVPQATFHEAQ